MSPSRRKEPPLPEGLTIVKRADWRAVEPKVAEMEAIVRPVANVLFTVDTRTRPCDTQLDCEIALQDMQWRQMDIDDADDIKYNFLIGGDNRVYEGRGYRKRPCASLPFPSNKNILHIGFIGRFPTYASVPDNYKVTAEKCILNGINNNFIKKDYKVHKSEPTPEDLYGELVNEPIFPEP